MNKAFSLVISLVLFLALVSIPARGQAQNLSSSDDPVAVSSAPVIVEGVTMGHRVVHRGDRIKTITRFHVDEVIRGEAVPSEILVVTLGGELDSGLEMIVEHQPELIRGERSRLYLRPRGERYLVVGDAQGQRVLEQNQDDSTALSQCPDGGIPGDGYCLIGASWSDGSMPISYYINPNSADLSTEEYAIQEAFTDWETDPYSDVRWSYRGRTSVAQNSFDSSINVFFASTPNNFLARTTYWARDGRLLHFDIEVNDRYQWSYGVSPDGFDLTSTMRHEVAHALGLDHVSDSGDLMYCCFSPGTEKHISEGNLRGIRALYPSDSPDDAPPDGGGVPPDPQPEPEPQPHPDVALVDDPSFWGPSQYIVSFSGVGWDGDMFRTWAEGDGYSAVNGAEWVSDISGGRYRVEVFIPRSHAVARVNYYIRHNGGQSVVSVDQSRYFDQWVSLGVYDINGPRASVGSNDASGTRATEIGWDAVRWVKTADPVSQPPPPQPQPEASVVDDPSFWGPSQYIARFTGLGWDGDMYRTWTEGADHAAVNGAEWVGNISGGRYRVEVFIPRSHAVATVKYYVRHNGGQSVVSVDQSRYFDQWVSLGVYDINGPRASVGSNDATGVRAQEIGWDAVRWVRV